MIEASNLKFPPELTGSNVLLPVPDVDLGRYEFRNLQGGVIITHGGGGQGVQYGSYTQNQFTVPKRSFLSEQDVPLKEISLREATRADRWEMAKGI